MSERTFQSGIYRCWKGGIYFAVLVANSSEDRNRQEVVYFSESSRQWWRRDLQMFLEDVPRDRLLEYSRHTALALESIQKQRFRLLATWQDGTLVQTSDANLSKTDTDRYHALIGQFLASIGFERLFRSSPVALEPTNG